MTQTTPAGRTAAIAAMPRYQPDRPPTRVDLSDNTSLWGPPPSVRATLAGLSDAQLSRYPSPNADALCAALGDRHGVDPACIVTGCGSDDVLDSAIRACCDAGSSIAVAVPTFSVVPSFAEVNEVRMAPVELRRDGTVRAADLLAVDADIYYLCSPNNPTGMSVPGAELIELLEATDSIVLVDEAYADYADTDAVALTEHHDNLVVVRTLSKAFGLAGLRVGYAVGHPDVVAAISASRGPYKVGALAEAVAIGVLRDDVEWVRARIDEVRELRAAFTTRLASAGFEVLHSDANFVAVLVDDAPGAFARMRDREVLVRAYASLAVFGDLLRITVAPTALLDEAFDALVDATR